MSSATCLGFVSLRGTLSDRIPWYELWRRLAPWLIGRFTTNRQAIATTTSSPNDFYLKFLDADALLFRKRVRARR